MFFYNKKRIMSISFQPHSFSYEINNFIENHKALCIGTLAGVFN